MGYIRKIENGQRFSMLTVLHEVEMLKKCRRFLCKCDCGNVKPHKLILLTTGQSKSCGCLRKKTFVERNTFHGKSRTKLNAVYQSMKQRCNNPNCVAYKFYGERGIKVCEDWDNSLMSFYNWAMENGYEEGLSIDRIDVYGNYEPKNCRWVKMEVQSRNKRDNVFIEFNEQRMCVQDWAKSLSINHATLTKRIRKWGIEKALTTPKSEKNDTTSFRNRK